MVKRKLVNGIPSLLLCVAAIIMIFPAIMILLRSFENGVSTYIDFYIWEPKYLHALSKSLVISLGASIGTVIVSTMAAYVFSKVKFKGRDVLFYLYIIVMMMPFQVTLLPQYMVSKSLGIYDTALSLILPGIFSPFATFLLTQVMKSVPNEIIEAARIDTSSTWKILLKIIIPSIKPGIICAWVLSFTEHWNAVAEPLILMETHSKYPLAVLLDSVSAESTLGFAAVVMFAVLPLLLFLLFETEVMEGLGEYRLK